MASIETSVNTTDPWLKRKLKHLAERRWLDLGLQAKMGVLVTIGMLGLMTIFGLLAVSSARQATQQALEERYSLTRMSAESLDTMLLHTGDDLMLFAQIPLTTDLGSSPGNPQITSHPLSVFRQPVYYLDSAGNLKVSSESSPPTLSWDQIPAIKAALQNNPVNFSAWPQYQPSTVVIATPIRNAAGRVTGAVAALLDLSDPNIFPIEDDLEENQSEIIDIVDPQGLIVFSSQADRVLQYLTEDLILTYLFQEQRGGVETCLGCKAATPIELSDEVVAFSPLASVPLGIVIRQPAEQVFSSVRSLVIWHTLLGALSMVGALGLVWATTNSVITPIQALTVAAQRIAEGDLNTPIEPLLEAWPFHHRQRRDEIGALGKNFDSMRVRRKTTLEEIHALNRELDQRVQARTSEAIAAQVEAQSAHDDLQAIINALSDQLIVIKVDDHRIVQANQAAREKFGYAGDITDLNCYQLFQGGHPCVPPDCACPLDEVLEREESVRVTHTHTNPGEPKPVYLDIIASPLRDARGKITRIVELVRDITDERATRASLLRRNQQLAILNAVATTVSQSLNLEEILGRALDEVIQRTGIDIGAIFLMEDALGELNLVAQRGLSEQAARMASQLGLLDGSCGGVIEHGQVVVVPNITTYRGQRASTLRKENITTLVHVPLKAKGCTLGSMCVGTREVKEFSNMEQEMLVAIGNQIAVAIDNARLYAELQQKEQVRRELFRKAINAQEDERKRIARELHDDTSQALTALMFAAEEGLEMTQVTEIRNRLESMRDLTRQTLDGVHKLLFDLRPSILDHFGLIPALRWFAKSRLEPQGVRVSIQENSQSFRLPSEVEIALFRVTQEAITNVARHAAARNVHISFDLSENQVEIGISDDGIGFDPTHFTISPDTKRGLGLLGMSERLELLNGEFKITSAPLEGTRIDIRVPLNGRIWRPNHA